MPVDVRNVDLFQKRMILGDFYRFSAILSQNIPVFEAAKIPQIAPDGVGREAAQVRIRIFRRQLHV